VLIAILKQWLQCNVSLYTLLQILSVPVFEKNGISCVLQIGQTIPESQFDANKLNLLNDYPGATGLFYEK